ncbi:MAG TPA: serine/threonine-protein kinase [Actinophytocola sp.]|nr:serine/threonine-protein kinase [Actinophytocola sp.]
MTQQHHPESAPQAAQQRVIAGRYVILDEIGRGGMGIVWLADDRTIGRRVAIKELHLPAGVPPDERAVLEERVLREARTAGRLNDPAVVTVYDVVQETGNTYIVMELIQAPTLSAIVTQRGSLPQEAVARLAEQLLSALEAAHAAGVVHRDVKPSNIMVSPNGRVKLTDFGIAQSTDDPRLTTSGILVGSPSYIAPERIRGGEADAGSDLWALAAVLFYAVEGHSPFERASTAATMHAILNEIPYLTRSQGPLASVIMGLLNSVPQARLTAPQVRGLLAQATQTPPTGTRTMVHGGTAMYPAPNATQLVPAGPAGRRRRAPVLVLVALLVAGAFVGGWFGGRAMLPEEPVDATKGATMTYGSGGQLKSFQLSNNSCSASVLREGRSYPSSSASCDEPHEFEVMEAVDPFSSEPELEYLKEPLTTYAEATCALVFASHRVPAEDKNDTLTYVTLVPTETSWDDAVDQNNEDGGDRGIYCLLTGRNDRQLEQQQISTE